jgi:hypothetical protein
MREPESAGEQEPVFRAGAQSDTKNESERQAYDGGYVNERCPEDCGKLEGRAYPTPS